MSKVLSLFFLIFAANAGHAFEQNSPVGLWKTIDDSTGKEKSLVRISEYEGIISGRIEKILDLSYAPNARCNKCTDERKDAPLVGLTVLRALRHNDTEQGIWDGGDVLDPKNGKVYRARLKPVEGGRKLELRGYFGPFYRTQTWHRIE